MNTWINQGTIENKSAHRQHTAWNALRERMFHKMADNGFFSKKGGPSNVFLTLCKH